MITINKVRDHAYNDYEEIWGLSTDTKPTKDIDPGIGNGSVFVEMDTSEVYGYDKANDTWIKM